MQIWHDNHPFQYGAHDARNSKVFINERREGNIYSAGIDLYGVPATIGEPGITGQGSSPDYNWTVAIVSLEPSYAVLTSAISRGIEINLPGSGDGGDGGDGGGCLGGCVPGVGN